MGWDVQVQQIVLCEVVHRGSALVGQEEQRMGGADGLQVSNQLGYGSVLAGPREDGTSAGLHPTPCASP